MFGWHYTVTVGLLRLGLDYLYNFFGYRICLMYFWSLLVFRVGFNSLCCFILCVSAQLVLFNVCWLLEWRVLRACRCVYTFAQRTLVLRSVYRKCFPTRLSQPVQLNGGIWSSLGNNVLDGSVWSMGIWLILLIVSTGLSWQDAHIIGILMCAVKRLELFFNDLITFGMPLSVPEPVN